MTKRVSFIVHFHKSSTHWVNVVVHTSAKTMRACLTRRGHKDSSTTEACCWQGYKPHKDGCIAEIHFATDLLTLDAIAHESSHAAWWRTVIIGMQKEDERFEEWVADDTGRLTDAILAYLDKEGIQVKYASAPKRSAIKRYVKK